MNGVMLYDLTRDELTELLAKWGEPTYRAKQVWEWLYKKLATHPSQMTNLPAALRNRLAVGNAHRTAGAGLRAAVGRSAHDQVGVSSARMG